MADMQQLAGSLLVGKNQSQPILRLPVAAIDPFDGDPVSVDPGTPVAPTGSPPTVIYARGDAQARAGVLGFAISAGEDPGSVDIQWGGPLTLTVAEWAAITGNAGGLVQGDSYWLSTATKGRITNSAPGADFITPVGYAISPTTLMIQIGIPVAAA